MKISSIFILSGKGGGKKQVEGVKTLFFQNMESQLKFAKKISGRSSKLVEITQFKIQGKVGQFPPSWWKKNDAL